MSLGGAFAAASVKVFVDYLAKRLTRDSGSSSEHQIPSPEVIERHLIEVVNWANQVQFFGMGVPDSTESATIALEFQSEPRRFRRATNPSHTKHERELIEDPDHCLLLGEPGSGKTTTLKRLARTLLTEPPTAEGTSPQYPLVVRLRELLEGEEILTRISDILGLSYAREDVIYHIPATSAGMMSRDVKHVVWKAGTVLLIDVLSELLNRSSALLLLDGLDEVRPEHRSRIREEMVFLGRRLSTAKIIVSCRSGDYAQTMEGFAVFEICPLSEEQIQAIKNRWLGADETSFFECLQNLPYFDLADRPLLLTQLLFVYKRYGYLPEQPSLIYKKIVRLLLEEWDATRGIRRGSTYSGFDPERKAEFLAALSFHLTYTLREKSFTEDDLSRAYVAICGPFGLPLDESIDVAQELQTHTGIIVAGPRDTYEFCHLSLQEYLCASYLVRAPFDALGMRHLASYSAPLAVAATLSSRPGSWLGSLLLDPDRAQAFDSSSMSSLISRLVTERPFFETSELLGFALVGLFRRFASLRNHLEDLLQLQGALASLALALRWYRIYVGGPAPGDLLEVRLRIGLEGPYSAEPPKIGAFPKRLLPELRRLSSATLFCEDALGSIHEITPGLALRLAQ